MQLAPAPTRPDPVFLIEPFALAALAVDLHPGAVDQRVQWCIPLDPPQQNRQPATAPAGRRMVRDREADAKQTTIDLIAPSVC